MTKRSNNQPSQSEVEIELEHWQKKNIASEMRQIEDYEAKYKVFKILQLKEAELDSELKLINIKMKEAEQEQKLAELKSRERKRQKPVGKLQPLAGPR